MYKYNISLPYFISGAWVKTYDHVAFGYIDFVCPTSLVGHGLKHLEKRRRNKYRLFALLH